MGLDALYICMHDMYHMDVMCVMFSHFCMCVVYSRAYIHFVCTYILLSVPCR